MKEGKAYWIYLVFLWLLHSQSNNQITSPKVESPSFKSLTKLSGDHGRIIGRTDEYFGSSLWRGIGLSSLIKAMSYLDILSSGL